MLTALLLAETPILAALIVGWLIAGLVYAAARAASATVLYIRSVLPLLQQYLGFGNRWRVLVPVVLVAPGSFIASFASVADKGGGNFLQRQNSFFQTAAQVIAALLVTMALTPQGGSNVEARVVRPVLGFAVIAAGLGELAAVSALVSTPSLSASLQPVVFSLTISGGSTALLAVVLAGRRLLGASG